MILVYIHPRCSTVKKVLQFLDEKNIKYITSDLTKNPIKLKEIEQYHQLSGLDIKKFFNTSGLKYRELDLKNKLDNLTLIDKYKLLASDGMLVKRPIITDGVNITIGGNLELISKTWHEKRS